MDDPQPPPLRGLVAGKYEIVGLIGRGGMGSVWEGRHASLGTRVAIKFIEQEYATSREAQSRFVVEARAAATIHSKHAIQIYDHGVTDDGRPYIVMELLVGEPLDKRIERLGRISLQETARVLGQVCRALQRAHDAGIIHRDLKPENIFIVRSPDDDDEVAKVLDFGIAKIKAAPGEAGLTSSTKTGAVLGTPYYMSPEQARGLRSLDSRSDLWSLGVIAYKCVTGVLPFEGESVGDLLVKICTGPLPRPSATTPGLPLAFDAWFVRALERDPGQRYATASELAEGLAYAAGISTRRVDFSSQPEGRTPIDLGVGTPVAPTVVGAGTSPFLDAGTSAPFTSPPAPSAATRGVLVAVVAAALVGGSLGVLAVVKLLSPTSDRRSAAPAMSASAPVPAPPAISIAPPAVASTTVRTTSTAFPKPIASKAATPLPIATTPASAVTPPPFAKPPPAKAASTTSDPGY